ncbi:MAG: cystathionine gamma-synthase family protein [Desulfocapsaceae bacterium]|nr:cystathionine gamma-synthase family protein [Desulfocapsaceae bacterium]
MNKRHPKKATSVVWAGEEDYIIPHVTQVPVVQSVSFAYEDIDEWQQVALGQKEGHIYSRNTNPTVDVFEKKICRLEGAEAATSASSGMAIISNTLFGLLSPGQRVVSVKDTYGGTNKIFTEFLPRFNIECILCNTTDHQQIEKEVARGCDLLYLETPTNPTIKIIDLERLTKAGKKAGAIVVVDNTFATPINQQPISLGADLVVHSATKFLGGHADALAGAVCGRKELVNKIYHFREINGASLDPMAAYLILRGMKTLALRIERQNQNALEIARFLQTHPQVRTVFYPGLEDHEGHDIASGQMSGFGAMLSFMLKEESLEAVGKVISRLRYAHTAANLGAVETIVGPPATTSHVECTREERQAMGIPESLIRYSTGIEDIGDLKEDLDQALAVLR